MHAYVSLIEEEIELDGSINGSLSLAWTSWVGLIAIACRGWIEGTMSLVREAAGSLPDYYLLKARIG